MTGIYQAPTNTKKIRKIRFFEISGHSDVHMLKTEIRQRLSEIHTYKHHTVIYKKNPSCIIPEQVLQCIQLTMVWIVKVGGTLQVVS